ncbi:hypothetical protein [Leifsonia sp. Leaf264]|uniref:hypothetical protein n=1 Tax=Leifsonia sp. Leaf264 TaxID=1736314 RepID=UPI0006F2ABC5|nr:hypothetical protein [Leifsonia sp. Leaf264]KQO98581.1 hypothetical protein ASF30_11000 [Leifsonia sp. Leaf264]
MTSKNPVLDAFLNNWDGSASEVSEAIHNLVTDPESADGLGWSRDEVRNAIANLRRLEATASVDAVLV